MADTMRKQARADAPSKGGTRRAPARRSVGGAADAFAIASVAVGVAGGACALTVSWMACIALGIVSIALGTLALRRGALRTGLAKLGIVVGASGIVASCGLVAYVSWKFINAGLI